MNKHCVFCEVGTKFFGTPDFVVLTFYGSELLCDEEDGSVRANTQIL
jgi:hypothetical protein